MVLIKRNEKIQNNLLPKSQSFNKPVLLMRRFSGLISEIKNKHFRVIRNCQGKENLIKKN